MNTPKVRLEITCTVETAIDPWNSGALVESLRERLENGFPGATIHVTGTHQFKIAAESAEETLTAIADARHKIAGAAHNAGLISGVDGIKFDVITVALVEEPVLTEAQAAWFDYRKECGSWQQPEFSHRHSAFMAGYAAAAAAGAVRIDFTDVPPVSTGNIEREYSRDHH